jgi:dienelactone hydrolase
VNQLLCILLFSVATGCASVGNGSQGSGVSSFESSLISTSYITKSTGWGNTPRPTIIIGHGCDGFTQYILDWGREFEKWGYNTVYYDSFSGKGYRNAEVCTSGMLVAPALRAEEVEEVAKWVKQQPWHIGKIAYIGESHGGATAIRVSNNAKNGKSNISAVVAMYPWCHTWAMGSMSLNKENGNNTWGWPMHLPTQIHLADGMLDSLTPPHQCKEIQNAEVYDYQGTTHAFDFPFPDRTLWGHRMKYNSKATALSRERIKKFLSENM